MSSESTTLEGEVVLITRPVHQAEALSARVTELGGTAVLYPTIEIIPLPVEPELLTACQQKLEAGTYNGIIVSSTNAVTQFARVFEIDARRPGPITDIPFFPVGPATAEAARNIGAHEIRLPKQWRAEGVLEQLLKATPPPLCDQQFLYPHSLRGRRLIIDGARQTGAVVDAVPVYETRPIEQGPPLDTPSPLTWLTFASPSAVTGFLNVMKPPVGVKIASIGPTTTKELNKNSIIPHIEAGHHSLEGLIEAILSYSQ